MPGTCDSARHRDGAGALRAARAAGRRNTAGTRRERADRETGNGKRETRNADHGSWIMKRGLQSSPLPSMG
ncbi:LysR family transcriptional regulator [Burkholderia pseudomallei]|nr:LysR family transcriptional regulator [Burkholderia pseudomallei]